MALTLVSDKSLNPQVCRSLSTAWEGARQLCGVWGFGLQVNGFRVSFQSLRSLGAQAEILQPGPLTKGRALWQHSSVAVASGIDGY